MKQKEFEFLGLVTSINSILLLLTFIIYRDSYFGFLSISIILNLYMLIRFLQVDKL